MAIHAQCISDVSCPGKPVLPLSLDQKIAVIGEAAMTAMIIIELDQTTFDWGCRACRARERFWNLWLFDLAAFSCAWPGPAGMEMSSVMYFLFST